ncbi:MAG: ankyrin repeat domain-containing protein [Gemmatirosa sp.]
MASTRTDANVRERGDETYPMHCAAAAGHLDVVRALADAGGDVVGAGDEHALQVIGWATCWAGCDDDAHRVTADLLVSRGARHHVFSAVALDLEDEVRRIVARDASALAQPMSRHESGQRPLHFAVRMRRPRMVALLLELGADPHAIDDAGHTAAAYATTPDADRAVMEAIRARGAPDLLAALVLRDWTQAERLVHEDGGVTARTGALHLMMKRGDVEAVAWLLAHGASPDARWSHWGAEVTPLHLAALLGHVDVVRLLLQAGADTSVHDSLHDSDALGWARHAGHTPIVELLRAQPPAA